jgi:hypothetical protein
MELKDLIVTPLVVMLVYVVAYVVRPYVTNQSTRRYFFPALTVRIIGALALGFLYQFYYGGGDTFNYHTHGSRIIWEAILNNPPEGLKLMFTAGEDPLIAYRYSSQILFFSDPSSYFVVRLAAFFDLFTFSTYSATAILFSVINFAGMWFFFNLFVGIYQNLHRWLAIAILFIPSVIFWGSGILKDSVVLACIGMLTYFVKKIFIDREFKALSIFLLLLSMFIIFRVKIYVLLCFLPAALLWIYASEFSKIRSVMLKCLLIPFVIAIVGFSSYYAAVKIGENDRRYSLENLARTAQITAYDIGFYTGRNAGSGYTFGELDYSITGMVKLAPSSINASLFRPYLWEVKNPLMLLSSLESLVLLTLTILILFKKRISFFRALGDPTILFCLVFSLSFAFAVGISTFNFGTLARYKIPLLPFYAIALICIANYENKERKVGVFEETE